MTRHSRRSIANRIEEAETATEQSTHRSLSEIPVDIQEDVAALRDELDAVDRAAFGTHEEYTDALRGALVRGFAHSGGTD